MVHISTRLCAGGAGFDRRVRGNQKSTIALRLYNLLGDRRAEKIINGNAEETFV
jgi:hypothetical protein